MTKDIYWIRRLLWLYFWLLLFEGALRKWILPFAATPLLIVRDPVVIAMYIFAVRANIFPRNVFVIVGGVIALLSLLVGCVVLQGKMLVPLYGFRTNFLQLPLIFLIPRVFDGRDLRQVGYWLLMISMPMALLMLAQFRASPDALINVGTVEGLKQISSAGDHIRAAGTFSFITGPISFYSLVAVFLLYSQTKRGWYPRWLVAGSTFSLLVAGVASGSRGFVAGLGIVFGFAFVYSVIYKPKQAFRMFSILTFLVVILATMQQVSFFKDAFAIFSERLSNASNTEGGSQGFFERIFGGYVTVIPTLMSAPFFGFGLGVGTNAGAAMLTGSVRFLLSEGEWQRIGMESGPVLGGSFILYRIWLTTRMGIASIRHAAKHDSLALLLFSVSGLNLLTGQLGAPTTLGFAIFTSGLCLAAIRITRAPRRVPRALRPDVRQFAIAPQQILSPPDLVET